VVFAMAFPSLPDVNGSIAWWLQFLRDFNGLEAF
jgi:hypothetical protein